MLIAQSGGPTAVINQSLAGAISEARKHARIRGIYGSLNGIRGILEERLVDLRRESPANLRKVAATPCAALGSVRRKPTREDCAAIFSVMRKHDIRFFFYIGGNDSAETASIINERAAGEGYDFRCFHVPKTIDNDLRENDHTPGYGSAARFVALALRGDDLDNRSLPGIKIDVVMGRHAGFLVAASALGRAEADSGPHLVYFPEKPFAAERFLADVEKTYARHGRCVVAVSEGIADSEGVPIASRHISEVDTHGNVQLSGSGILGDILADMVRRELKVDRVRADTFGYLQRSFPGIVSESDAREAWAVGEEAVRRAVVDDVDGSVVIRRVAGRRYEVRYETVPLEKVARETRRMPASFINRAGNNVTEAFLDYARPLVGQLPEIGYLKAVPVSAARERA